MDQGVASRKPFLQRKREGEKERPHKACVTFTSSAGSCHLWCGTRLHVSSSSTHSPSGMLHCGLPRPTAAPLTEHSYTNAHAPSAHLLIPAGRVWLTRDHEHLLEVSGVSAAMKEVPRIFTWALRLRAIGCVSALVYFREKSCASAASVWITYRSEKNQAKYT